MLGRPMPPADDALAALRATLPWWSGWAPLLLVPLAFVLAWIGAYLGVSASLLARRGAPEDAHWSVRARALFPARMTAASAPLFGAITAGILPAYLLGPIARVPAAVLGLSIGLAAFAGAWPQVRRADRLARGRTRPLGDHLAGQVFAFVALTPHVIVVLLAAVFMPAEPVPATMLAVVVLALLLAIALGANLRLAIALGLAWPADERLARIVEETSAKVGVRARHTWIVRWPMVNALAYPRTGDLAFTEDAVARLSDEELAEITAHELGHLGEPRSIVLARSLGLVALFPIAILRPVVLSAGDDLLHRLVAAMMLLVASVVMLMVLRRIARRMEERADAVAHEHEHDSGAYARALERIYELNLLPAVTWQRRPIHPHLYDRLISAGVAPSYPRPAMPSRLLHTLGLVIALLPFFGLGAVRAACAGAPAAEGSLAMAISGGDTGDLWQLAVLRAERRDGAGAIAALDALGALDPWDPTPPAYASIVAAQDGDCARARVAFEEAERRAHAIESDPATLIEAWSVVAQCTPRE